MSLPTLLWSLTLAAVSTLCASDSAWEQHFSKGEGLERQGQHAAAGREFQAALVEAEQMDPNDASLPLTLHNLGTVARELGSYPEAERYYQRAVSIWETRHPGSPAQLAVTLQNLGALNMVWGRLSRAETLYRRAYELRLQALGPNHAHVGASLHGLAELAAARHHYAEANDLYRQAAAVLQAAYGPDSLRVADVWHNWGYLCKEMQHRDQEARTMLDRAAAIYEKTVPDHPNMAIILRNLAELDMKAGDLAQAGTRFERSLMICRNSLPPGHQQTGIILSAYGRYLQQAGRKKEAKFATEKAREILTKPTYTVDVAAFTK